MNVLSMTPNDAPYRAGGTAPPALVTSSCVHSFAATSYWPVDRSTVPLLASPPNDTTRSLAGSYANAPNRPTTSSTPPPPPPPPDCSSSHVAVSPAASTDSPQVHGSSSSMPPVMLCSPNTSRWSSTPLPVLAAVLVCVLIIARPVVLGSGPFPVTDGTDQS